MITKTWVFLFPARNHIACHRLFQTERAGSQSPLPPNPDPLLPLSPASAGLFFLRRRSHSRPVGNRTFALALSIRGHTQRHKNCFAMNILDEYRRNAQECQRMAENAGNAADKASWLRLAASWLTMIKSTSSRIFETGDSERHERPASSSHAWPGHSEKDSKRSH